MNVSIFGASGVTGRLLTERCLRMGHRVKVLVRTPGPFQVAYNGSRPGDADATSKGESGDDHSPRIEIIRGSAFDPAAVRQTVAGAEVVLSALGAHSPLRNENVLPRAVPVIVDAMQHLGVRRIIVLGSAGALPDSLKLQPALRRWIVQNIVYTTVAKWPVLEQISQYKTLAASGLDWTMVMPPMLTNGSAHGNYRVDGEALPRYGTHISRQDVADFMVYQLDSSQWLRKGVYLAY
jgi:putative NADH-flavin reductase